MGLEVCFFPVFWAVGTFPTDLLSGDNESAKLALLSWAVGPHGLCRAMEDRAAAAGNSLCIRACIDAGVGDFFLALWF